MCVRYVSRRREIFWINYYDSFNSGMNLTLGGSGSLGSLRKESTLKGKPLSEEIKEKISKSHKGKTLSDEHKKALAKAKKGYNHSEETKLKIKESNKGKIETEEHRDKLKVSSNKRTDRKSKNNNS